MEIVNFGIKDFYVMGNPFVLENPKCYETSVLYTFDGLVFGRDADRKLYKEIIEFYIDKTVFCFPLNPTCLEFGEFHQNCVNAMINPGILFSGNLFKLEDEDMFFEATSCSKYYRERTVSWIHRIDESGKTWVGFDILPRVISIKLN